MASNPTQTPSTTDRASYRAPGGLLIHLWIWQLLKRNLRRGKHTLITGPTGTGKTRLACNVAKHLGLPCEVFHMGGVFDAEASLTGTTGLRSGDTRFEPSRFVHALTRPGCVIVADEINRASGAALNALLGVLDWQGRLAVDLADGPRRVVTRASGVVVLATANIGPDYIQTTQLDMALLNRLHIVRLGFPDDEQVLLEEHGATPAQAARIMRTAREIRRAFTEGRLPATVSTRQLIEVAELMRDGFAVETAFEAQVAAFDEPSVAALRAIVRATE